MSSNIICLVRPEIAAMNAYKSARNEQAQGNIWLDANENPWNKLVYNRYPEPQPAKLVSTLAAIYGMQTEQLLITRGSDEGIDLLLRLFCAAGKDKIMICPPTYGMYKVAASIQDCQVVTVPLIKEQGFMLNVSSILASWEREMKLIFLCSPNNPTGNLLAVNDILTLCKEFKGKAMIIVDEAYIEFAGCNSMAKFIDHNDNLIILRTLSKAYGMAGIRCGTILANPTVIELLKKIIAPYPIPKPVANIAINQLSKNAINTYVKIINQEKEKLFQFLSRSPLVKKVWRSDANFLLFEAININEILALCRKSDIVIRRRDHEYNLNNCLRVTIGEPNENTILMGVLSCGE